MGRTLDADMATAIAADSGYGDIWFIELESANNAGSSVTTTRYTTAPADVTWDGSTWVGIGGAIEISPTPESEDFSGQSCQLSLSGVDTTVIDEVLTQNVRGRDCNIYWGQVNTATGAIAEASAGEGPILAFAGMLNSAWEISVTPSSLSERGTVRISTTVVSRMARYVFARELKTNLTSHQEFLERAELSTTDLFFRYVPDLMGKPLYWGFTGTKNPYTGVPRLTPRPNWGKTWFR